MLTYHSKDRLTLASLLGAALAVVLLHGGVPLVFAFISGALVPLLASCLDPGDPV